MNYYKYLYHKAENHESYVRDKIWELLEYRGR